MSSLVETRAVEDAARAIQAVAVRTPLLPAPWLAEEIGAEVRLKCENLQRAGAFKIRGAYNLISRLADDDRRRGVITYSSGNHAQAVALAAREFGIPATVVMPTTAPTVKREGAAALGAEVILEGTTSIERQKRAESIAAERGLTMVPPFDHPDIIAGQGTVGKEILEDWGEVEDIIVPIGGGGLISGTAAWIKQIRPSCRIIGVEPEGADAMRTSIQEGRPTTIQVRQSLADGLLPARPGDLTFAHVREFVDEIITLTDDEIRDAADRILRAGKLLVEYSGAATVAALTSRRWQPRGRNTVAILSGGNRDMPGSI